MDIIDAKKLDKSCKFFVVHESSLPQGKGFAPLIWQIIEGKKTIDICLFELEKEVDSGRIVIKDKIKLNGNELYNEIRKKQANATFTLIDLFLKSYPNIEYKEQSGKSSFYKRRSPKDSEINPNKSIKDQFDLLRTCNNQEWPAFFRINGQRYILKIHKMD